MPPSSDLTAAAFNNVDDLYTLLNTIAEWFYAFVLVLAVVAVLYGAFTYVTAAGDSEKLTQARWIVIGALIGTAIATLSRGVIIAIQKAFE
jgi:hypothetical protein